MAKTNRNIPKDLYYRSPRQINEERRLRSLLNDARVDEDFLSFRISGMNKIRKRLKQMPEIRYRKALPISASFEEDHHRKDAVEQGIEDK